MGSRSTEQLIFVDYIDPCVARIAYLAMSTMASPIHGIGEYPFSIKWTTTNGRPIGTQEQDVWHTEKHEDWGGDVVHTSLAFYKGILNSVELDHLVNGTLDPAFAVEHIQTFIEAFAGAFKLREVDNIVDSTELASERRSVITSTYIIPGYRSHGERGIVGIVEALGEMIDHVAFEELGFAYITGTVNKTNARSIRALEKRGMTFLCEGEGTYIYYKTNPTFVDSLPTLDGALLTR